MPGRDSRDDDTAAAAEEAFVESMDALQASSCPRLLARAMKLRARAVFRIHRRVLRKAAPASLLQDYLQLQQQLQEQLRQVSSLPATLQSCATRGTARRPSQLLAAAPQPTPPLAALLTTATGHPITFTHIVPAVTVMILGCVR